MRRTKGHWTGLFVAVGLTLCCYAQDAPQTSQPPAPTHHSRCPTSGTPCFGRHSLTKQGWQSYRHLE